MTYGAQYGHSFEGPANAGSACLNISPAGLGKEACRAIEVV